MSLQYATKTYIRGSTKKENKTKTLGKLIAIASKAFDGLAGEDYEGKGAMLAAIEGGDRHCGGDGLAAFIALELKESYDETATDEEQILTAFKTMLSVRDQVLEVTEAFAKLL